MATIRYTETRTEEREREVVTVDDLLLVLFEIGYGRPVVFEVEHEGRAYRVNVLLEGETTGLRLDHVHAA